MNTPIVRTSILIHAPVEAVWDAIVNPVIVKQYLFGTDMETSWEVGSPIFFRGVWEGKTYEDKGVIQTFVPTHSLSYTYRSSMDETPDLPENYHLVTFQVDPRDAGVELSITQTVATEEKAEHSTKQWNTVLCEIKNILEQK